jgi:hypothetical protein
MAMLMPPHFVYGLFKKGERDRRKGEKRVSFQENKEALNYKGATREA